MISILHKCFEEISVVILHIYRDRSTFLLFYDNLDNECNYREIKISILYKMGENLC